MYFCYLDESGTPEIQAQTSHFVFVGLAIPASAWHPKDQRISAIKSKYGLQDAEIHTGFLARRYPDQEHVPDFEGLDWAQRRASVSAQRAKSLVTAAALHSPNRLNSLKKSYRKTADYTHLTHSQRIQLLRDLADEIGTWIDARLFAEAIDKRTVPAGMNVFESAFEQLVYRFHTFLEKKEKQRLSRGGTASPKCLDNRGLLIQDNNETVAKKLPASCVVSMLRERSGLKLIALLRRLFSWTAASREWSKWRMCALMRRDAILRTAKQIYLTAF